MNTAEQLVRERYEKDPAKYSDGLVAADLNLQHGIRTTASAVADVRRRIGIMLPGEKLKPKQSSERGDVMARIRLNDEQYEILANFVAETIKAEPGTTEAAVVDIVNEKKPIAGLSGPLSLTHIRKAKELAGLAGRAKKGKKKKKDADDSAELDAAERRLSDAEPAEFTFKGLAEMLRKTADYAEGLQEAKRKQVADLFL